MSTAEQSPAAVPETKPAPAPARIVSSLPRDATVKLIYPIEFDGKQWDEVRVRRVTGVEISNYMEALSRGEKPLPPTFDFPTEVYEALDDDDLLAVEQAAFRFLPRRLRATADAALAPQPGATTSGS